MVLIYNFRKYLLENGKHIERPVIDIYLSGQSTIEASALIDSGADITTISEKIARSLGLDLTGVRQKVFGYHESSEITLSKVDIIFLGKETEESVRMKDVPVWVGIGDYTDDIILGTNEIFDTFDITFKKRQNKIILKKVE